MLCHMKLLQMLESAVVMYAETSLSLQVTVFVVLRVRFLLTKEMSELTSRWATVVVDRWTGSFCLLSNQFCQLICLQCNWWNNFDSHNVCSNHDLCLRNTATLTCYSFQRQALQTMLGLGRAAVPQLGAGRGRAGLYSFPQGPVESSPVAAMQQTALLSKTPTGKEKQQ